MCVLYMYLYACEYTVGNNSHVVLSTNNMYDFPFILPRIVTMTNVNGYLIGLDYCFTMNSCFLPQRKPSSISTSAQFAEIYSNQRRRRNTGLSFDVVSNSIDFYFFALCLKPFSDIRKEFKCIALY